MKYVNGEYLECLHLNYQNKNMASCNAGCEFQCKRLAHLFTRHHFLYFTTVWKSCVRLENNHQDILNGILQAVYLVSIAVREQVDICFHGSFIFGVGNNISDIHGNLGPKLWVYVSKVLFS